MNRPELPKPMKRGKNFVLWVVIDNMMFGKSVIGRGEIDTAQFLRALENAVPGA